MGPRLRGDDQAELLAPAREGEQISERFVHGQQRPSRARVSGLGAALGEPVEEAAGALRKELHVCEPAGCQRGVLGSEVVAWGTPNCGKGQPGQVGHTGHPAAAARFTNVRVGVTG